MSPIIHALRSIPPPALSPARCTYGTPSKAADEQAEPEAPAPAALSEGEEEAAASRPPPPAPPPALPPPLPPHLKRPLDASSQEHLPRSTWSVRDLKKLPRSPCFCPLRRSTPCSRALSSAEHPPAAARRSKTPALGAAPSAPPGVAAAALPLGAREGRQQVVWRKGAGGFVARRRCLRLRVRNRATLLRSVKD